MNTLTLSPTVYAICERSGSFRTHRYYDTLNVCNVVRSMLFVLLVKTALPAFLAAVLLNGVLQVLFVMAFGWVNPSDAMDILVYSIKAMPFYWYSPGSWFMVLSVAVSGLAVLFGGCIAFGVPLLFAGYWFWSGLKWLVRATYKVNTSAITTLGPVEVVAEYVKSKHSKFCRNIDSTPVIPKMTYAEELRNQMEAQLSKHWHWCQKASIDELLVSIEKNRAILAKYA